MWIFAVAFDCHRARWSRPGVDHSSAVLALIPDYAMQEEEAD